MLESQTPAVLTHSRMKAILAVHKLDISSNLNWHCLCLAKDAAQLLQHRADYSATQTLGTDFGSNLANVPSPLCQMPSCRNSCGATRVPAAPVSGLQPLYGFMAQPSRAEFCFSCSPGTVGTQQMLPHHIHMSQHRNDAAAPAECNAL